MARSLVICLMAILFGIATAHAEEKTRIDLNIALHGDLAGATLIVTVQKGTLEYPTTRPARIPASRSEHSIDLGTFDRAAPGELYFVHGKFTDSAQEPIGYIPVSVIDLRKYARKDYIRFDVVSAPTTGEALLRSFPLRETVPAALESFDVGDVLNGTRIALVEKWVTQSQEWDRITSDYLMALPNLLARDSSKVSTAFRFLEEYVAIAENQRFDSFYVEFLLRMKRAGIGGTIIGSQTLNDMIFSALNKMFAERIASTAHWSSNTLRTYRETSTPDRSHECIELATLLMDAVSAAIVRGDLDVTGDSAVAGNITSMQQAATECAQDHYVVSDSAASRVDVAGAAAFLAADRQGNSFLDRYIALFETMERRGLMPTRPRGRSATRINEVRKYYEHFHDAFFARTGEG